jgi:hypothetical protein
MSYISLRIPWEMRYQESATATQDGFGREVNVLPGLGAFWLIGGSAFHDEAHDAFMTLPPYTRIREGEVHQLGSGPKPCRLSLGVRKCSQLGQFEIHQNKEK